MNTDADTTVRIETPKAAAEIVDLDLDPAPTDPPPPPGSVELFEARTPRQRSAARAMMHQHSARFDARRAEDAARWHHTERARRYNERARRHLESARAIRVSLKAASRPPLAEQPAALTAGPRARGAGRPAAQRAAGLRAGQDPGGADPEPPEPPERRLCQLPGCDQPARRKYCTDQHADLGRQRRHRAKSRSRKPNTSFSDLVVEGLDRRRYDIAPNGVVREFWLPPESPGRPTPPGLITLEDLQRRAREGCRCNGHHIAAIDEDGVRCVKCGHWRRDEVAA
jgi:hypothetical protein